MAGDPPKKQKAKREDLTPKPKPTPTPTATPTPTPTPAPTPTQPATTQPATTQPATTQPATTQPAPPPPHSQTAQAPVSNAVRAAREHRAADEIRRRNAPKPEPGLISEGPLDLLGDLLGVNDIDDAENEVVELMGSDHAQFKVSALHHDLIAMETLVGNPSSVKVRFGDVAYGSVMVKLDDNDMFQSTSYGILPFHHPDLPPLEAPFVLVFEVLNNFVYGLIAADWGGQSSMRAPGSSDLKPIDAGNAQRYLGLEDLQDLQASDFANQLVGGQLTFGYSSMSYLFDGLFAGSGHLTITDDKPADFDATADVEAKAVDKSTIHLVRDALGELGVNTTVGGHYKTTEGYTLDGTLNARFDRGVVDIRGSMKYGGGAASGEVTVMIADEATAWAAVRQRLGDKAPPVPESHDAPNGLAFVGWGTLDFAVNDWLRGNVEVVLDPDGYVTAMGKLRPKDFTLFDKRDPGEKNIIPPESFSMWVPEPPIRLAVKLTLTRHFWMGPGTLSEVAVDGVFTTRPHVPTEFHVEGLFRVPAHADVALTITGEATAIGLAGVTGKIAGAVAVDAEAYVRPYIGRRRDRTDPSKAHFYVGGTMGLQAAMTLGFSGGLGFVIKTPWPFPDITWMPIDVHRKLWEIGRVALSVGGHFELGKLSKVEPAMQNPPHLDTSFIEKKLSRLDLAGFADGMSKTDDVHSTWNDDVHDYEEPKGVPTTAPETALPSEVQPTPTLAEPEIPSFAGATPDKLPPPDVAGARELPPGGTTPTPTPAGPTSPPVAPGVTTPPASEPDPTMTPGPPPITEPFYMQDTPHTLYLVREAQPYILMGSPQIDRLRVDLGLALNVVDKELRGAQAQGASADDRTVENLKTEMSDLKEILVMCDQVEARAVVQAASGHVAGFEQLAGELNAYASLYNRQDLITTLRDDPTTALPPVGGGTTPGRRLTAWEVVQRDWKKDAAIFTKNYTDYVKKPLRKNQKQKMSRDDYLEMRSRFFLGWKAETPSIELYKEETGLGGLQKNTKKLFLTAPNDPDYPRRIPDVYEPGRVIADVKNVSYQALTAQIIDDASIANLKPGDFFYDKDHKRQEKQTTPRFDLIVRAPWHERSPGTDVDPKVQDLIHKQGGDIYDLIEDPKEPVHEN